MKYIQLTTGQKSLVDDEDFDYLSQWSWYCDSAGYAVRYSNSLTKKYRIHREVMGTPTGLETDHINHNRLDNRKANLRICTRGENSHNIPLAKNNTSGFKGVSWKKSHNQWEVKIRINNIRKYLGMFKNKIEAARCYDKAARYYFGSFATLNFEEDNHD